MGLDTNVCDIILQHAVQTVPVTYLQIDRPKCICRYTHTSSGYSGYIKSVVQVIIKIDVDRWQ